MSIRNLMAVKTNYSEKTFSIKKFTKNVNSNNISVHEQTQLLECSGSQASFGSCMIMRLFRTIKKIWNYLRPMFGTEELSLRFKKTIVDVCTS